jgi:hypothetical protein
VIVTELDVRQGESFVQGAYVVGPISEVKKKLPIALATLALLTSAAAAQAQYYRNRGPSPQVIVGTILGVIGGIIAAQQPGYSPGYYGPPPFYGQGPGPVPPYWYNGGVPPLQSRSYMPGYGQVPAGYVPPPAYMPPPQSYGPPAPQPQSSRQAPQPQVAQRAPALPPVARAQKPRQQPKDLGGPYEMTPGEEPKSE